MDFLISDAMAQNGQATGSGLAGLIFPIALIVIFYFLLIRPQQKRSKEHKKLVANLGKGDEVLTSGGVLGHVTEVGEGYASLEIADGVEVRIQKAAVTQILPKGTIKQKVKKGDAPAAPAKGKPENGKTNK
ncbi:MAG: preprotein translocase subunit YajC [Nitrococcus sp.]|nr:preprotein translocase subunit YajC [Nitrococcus sp.]